MNVQIFGEEELIQHLKNGGSIYSHLISIGNPKKLIGKQNHGQFIPDIFKSKFKKILRLDFFDVDKKEHLRPKQFPKKIPESIDIKKIINFYNTTKNEATGYTIHCWRGVSRSTAVGLCILYMITKLEDKARQLLQQIRPQAMPLKRIVELFDLEYGSNLTDVHSKIQNQWIEKMKKELNYNPDDYIEDLESVD